MKKDAERSRLAELPWNPFINGIMQTFYDDRNLYLMLELIPSGSFRSALRRRAPFDAATAAFYYANIVCGLTFLEEHDIVHRDLKPDNILMGPDGYLSLADFGSAALELEETDWMLVGTPAYIAPECISPQGQTGSYGKSVDWWASGCILHEMLTGKMVSFFIFPNLYGPHSQLWSRHFTAIASNRRIARYWRRTLDGPKKSEWARPSNPWSRHF